MNHVNPEVWVRLSNLPVRGDTLAARRASPDRTERLLAAVDGDGRRHLLIVLAAGDEPLDDADSRGLRVATRELDVPDHGRSTYIDIMCVDPNGHDALDVIGGELAEGLFLQDVTPSRLVSRVLAKWRRFWGQTPSALLSREEQLGLFAELWFLLRWLLPATDAATAAARWRGPFGARHDFEWTGGSVEVKASAHVHAPVFRIHGLEQLDPPQDGRLLLFALRTREEGGATHSLPSLVDEVSAALSPDAAALEQFEAVLALTRYSPLHDRDYSRVLWRIVEERLYPVGGTFPMLTAGSLVERRVPAGVEEISYSINLGAYTGDVIEEAQAASIILR